MDLDEYRKSATKRSKFRNVRTGGYDSIKEFNRAQDLKILLHAGVISDLEEQPKFRFEDLHFDNGRVMVYTADFQYREDGKLVVEDVKSVATRTAVYRIKKALMRKYYGIEVTEV